MPKPAAPTGSPLSVSQPLPVAEACILGGVDTFTTALRVKLEDEPIAPSLPPQAALAKA